MNHHHTTLDDDIPTLERAPTSTISGPFFSAMSARRFASSHCRFASVARAPPPFFCTASWVWPSTIGTSVFSPCPSYWRISIERAPLWRVFVPGDRP